MPTMRAVDEKGFGQKVRDWTRTEMVERWRERWAELANDRLAELDIDARIDHRSLEAQGIALEPQNQIGAPAKRIEGRGIEGQGTEKGIEADRAAMHREIARGNGAQIIADPSLGLDAITVQQSTFTRRDLAKFAHRHSDGTEQFNEVMGAMRKAPDLVELGKDARGEDRFTTREMHRAAELMAKRERHEVRGADREAALARAEARDCAFGRTGRRTGACHGWARFERRGWPCRNGKERDAGRGAGGLGSRRLRGSRCGAVRYCGGKSRKRIGHIFPHHRQPGAWLAAGAATGSPPAMCW
jgi:ATP-dependent exoDNAse (exonuclease V) alpha subunit